MSGEPETLPTDSASSHAATQGQTSSYSAKVAEIFYTASNAFHKLGEITVNLNSTNVDPDENRWSETEINGLHNALLRFANDLESVSDSLLSRSKLMIRKDIKRRTLQLGSEMSGGATIGSASRTMFRPAVKSEAAIYSSSVNIKDDHVPMVAETQTITVAGTSQDPNSPSIHEEPPVLTPASDIIPIKKEMNTFVRRSVPGKGVAMRRVPVGGQSLRLINTAPGSQPMVRQRIMISNSGGVNPTYTSNRHIPYARVSNNSPQLVSASKTRLIPTSNTTPSTNNESRSWNTKWNR
ncbi:Chromatin complexes subunit BAP18 [Aphelenchoides bicaudatus]|nr:Chromatin complexes subunit BAP18 [Aphelenchoides bicaudatus]